MADIHTQREVRCRVVGFLTGLSLIAFAPVQVSWSFAQAPPPLVKVTSLGSHAGELCSADRAMLFEDPTGVRILYDPGNTDETDPRLGDVHVVLVTHGHFDHIGGTRPNRSAPGTCAAPTGSGPNANSNAATIAAAKGAVVIAPVELGLFLGAKIQAARGGAPVPGCAAPGLDNETSVPGGSPCMAFLNPGGSRTIRRGAEAVRISGVFAVHGSNVGPPVSDAAGLPPGTSGYVGLSNGYVIRFTNGLVAYLTGDTGMFGDMERIIARFYRPGLVVINISDIFVTGPSEAAFVIRDLVRPTTVMPTHVNEAATSGGIEARDTRTERFIRLVGSFADVVLPLSDVTRMFDGEGRCIGCR